MGVFPKRDFLRLDVSDTRDISSIICNDDNVIRASSEWDALASVVGLVHDYVTCCKHCAEFRFAGWHHGHLRWINYWFRKRPEVKEHD